MEPDDLIKVLQASIAPCVLISGFGFLLLSMINRLGRSVDRIRILNSERKSKKDPALDQQIDVIYRRCQYLQNAIALITICIFFVSITVLLLFSNYIFGVNLSNVIQILFPISVLCLIASLIYFLLDIRLTLNSIRIEINR